MVTYFKLLNDLARPKAGFSFGTPSVRNCTGRGLCFRRGVGDGVDDVGVVVALHDDSWPLS